VAEAKAMIHRLAPTVDPGTRAATVAALLSRWESPEAAEGIAAFFDGRDPNWTRS
jgi:methylglutaconyl-CoA hydratase